MGVVGVPGETICTLLGVGVGFGEGVASGNSTVAVGDGLIPVDIKVGTGVVGTPTDASDGALLVTAFDGSIEGDLSLIVGDAVGSVDPKLATLKLS